MFTILLAPFLGSFIPYVQGYTNYAALENWELYSTVFSEAYPFWSPSYWDTTVTHEGNPSIRNEGYYESNATHGYSSWGAYSNYTNREINHGWIPVSGGDNVCFHAWIKTDPNTTTPTYPQNGARIGIDFSDGSNWDHARAACSYNPDGGVPVIGTNVSAATVNASYVPMNSDWTYRLINLTVPSGVWSGTTLTGPIVGMRLWFQVYHGYTGGLINEEMGDVWFSETILTINEEYTPPYYPTISIFEDTFETGLLSKWDDNVTGTGDTLTVVSTDPYNGSYHLKATASGSAGDMAYTRKQFTGQTELWSQAEFQVVTALPADGESFNVMAHQGTTDHGAIRIYNDSGTYKWQLYYATGASTGTLTNASAPEVSLGEYYNLELHTLVHASAGEFHVYLNGTLILTVTGVDNNDPGATISWIAVGERYSSGATAHSIYVDNVKINDSYIGVQPEEVEPPGEGPDTYVFDVSISSPLNATYTVSSINYLVSYSGNETSVSYQINVYFLNGTVVYGSNYTSANGVFSDLGIASYMMAVSATGAHGDSEYETVYFSYLVLPDDTVLPSLSTDSLWTFLYAGDFIGFFFALLTVAFTSLDIAIGVVSMLFLVPLYIRTRSLLVVCIAWILVGAGIIVVMPVVSVVAVLFMALGIGGVVYRLFRPSSSY